MSGNKMDDEAGLIPETEHHELRPFAQNNYGQQSRASFLSTISINSCRISNSGFARGLVYFLVVLTCVPLVVGGAFTSIFIEDGNYNAGVWAFFTACLSLGALSIFVLHLMNKIETYHDPNTLEGIKIFAMFMSIASGISMGIYLILSFLNKQAFRLEGANYLSSALFGGVCLGTSLFLYYAAQWYQNALRMAERLARFGNSTTLNSTSSVVN